MAEIEKESKTAQEGAPSSEKVLIIDGMAVVNQVNMKGLQTCKDFAAVFTSKVKAMANSYTEVRLVFDRYLERSLKNRTRSSRTSGIQIR